MDLARIRRTAIIAMFSDDTLFRQLALKGGNALNLVHGLGNRTSIDVDLSLEDDFFDLDDSRRRIFNALQARFAEIGLAVFDAKFTPRPPQIDIAHDRWGGYQVEFKLMEFERYLSARQEPGRASREAVVIGPDQHRTLRVQISKHEFCRGKIEMQIDDYAVVVYTLEMIAIEKLRAICQQMPEYPHRAHPVPRARDFYDIHSICTSASVNLGSKENLELVRNIFAAKDVDLRLLSRIRDQREFHRQDWPSVQLTVSGELKDFDVYFDYVLQLVELLKPLWEK